MKTSTRVVAYLEGCRTSLPPNAENIRSPPHGDCITENKNSCFHKQKDFSFRQTVPETPFSPHPLTSCPLKVRITFPSYLICIQNGVQQLITETTLTTSVKVVTLISKWQYLRITMKHNINKIVNHPAWIPCLSVVWLVTIIQVLKYTPNFSFLTLIYVSVTQLSQEY